MNRKGFTLIELLIVIIILGVMASLITGNFFTSLKKGRDTKRKADLEQITRALEMYYEDKKTFPVTAGLTFGASLTDSVSGKVYMQKVPNDPTSGKDYEYVSTGSDYKLYACMENNLQILPYSNLSGTPTISCSTTCSNNEVPPVSKPCYWGVSSSDISP